MPKTPSSTYRVQLHPGFNFKDASAIADYLASLGISHLYASPYLQSAPGSTHGYDLADFGIVNEELGGADGHALLCRRLGECGLGQILDIVPNHMTASHNNPYWIDVLKYGRVSPYADYFDIDWEAGEERLKNKILLPILENQYGLVLSQGSIKLTRNDTAFEITINNFTRLPVATSSMWIFLQRAAGILGSDKLAFLADDFARLSPKTRDDPAAILKARRDRKILISLFNQYLAEDAAAIPAVDEAIAAINADTDQLDDFLQRQHYRLAYWRSADQDLGYRRFFDVNSLIGMRVEHQHVFLDTHKLILGWLKSGVLDGVRVDHVDGLRDPQRYLERLHEAAPDAWIVVEKILAQNEALPAAWPVQGTSGYDFLNLVNGLIVEPGGLQELDAIYAGIIGRETDYPELVHEKKIAVTVEGLGSDVNRLTSSFLEICESDRNHRDHTRGEIRHALREVAACFQVYRSYVSPERNELTELDAAVIQNAIDVAAAYRPDIDRILFDFMADVLLLRRQGDLESEFLLRFQQFTSPVMAKGLEDTALYCYNRLVGLNDVGSNLTSPIVSIDDFHRSNAMAQQFHPNGMVTLTTHDTKRGEDVRARLAVLSEMPQEFKAAVSRWYVHNSGHRIDNLPDPNTEYLYYQTLIGAWPISAERAIAYMEKATREAKQQTSWTLNNFKFEDALKAFIRATLEDEAFCAEVASFVKQINPAGRIKSLVQTLLKHTVPGVPDLYQGCELWDHRLVDPDNRTPVDFAQRRQMLAELDSMTAEQMMERMEEGYPKLWLTHQALRIRQKYRDSFNEQGSYEPLLATGIKSDRVVAFMRGGNVIAVTPRYSYNTASEWHGTTLTLPAGTWNNALTGESIEGGTVAVDRLLARFPVALLTKED